MFFRVNNLEDYPIHLTWNSSWFPVIFMASLSSHRQMRYQPPNRHPHKAWFSVAFVTMLSSITFLDLKTVKLQLARGKRNLRNHALIPISFCTGFQTDSLMNEKTDDFQKMIKGLWVKKPRILSPWAGWLIHTCIIFQHQISYVSVSSLCNLLPFLSKPIHC